MGHFPSAGCDGFRHATLTHTSNRAKKALRDGDGFNVTWRSPRVPVDGSIDADSAARELGPVVIKSVVMSTGRVYQVLADVVLVPVTEKKKIAQMRR